jgi:hypothetical protein
MKNALFTLLACSLFVNAAVAQDHKDVVERVRRELTAKGVIPAGIVNPGNNENPCGVFEITKRVAWELRAEGAGLLSKPSGNNCHGYSMDWVVYADGRGSDIAAGGVFDGVPTDAVPVWNIEINPDHGARWRPPFEPEDLPSNPAPPPSSPAPSPAPAPSPVPVLDLSGLEKQIAALDAKLDSHIQSTEAFQAQARGVWQEFFKPVLTFTSKYILPAVGGWLIGAEVAK